MNQSDLVDLLTGAVEGDRWADLGAGEGNFTLALAELLGPGAHITAVDKDRQALRVLADKAARLFPQTTVEVLAGDFTKPLELRDLDGIVMANSLHFVRDKGPVLQAVKQMLKPSGRLVLIEYGSDRGNPWVPHPMSFETWRRLADEAGLPGTVLLHTVPSRYLGSIYSALSRRPA